jgi:hypothetical protein
MHGAEGEISRMSESRDGYTTPLKIDRCAYQVELKKLRISRMDR